jgi:BASS family bile acid:Na+ symporter
MLVRAKNPGLAARLDRPVRVVSATFLLLVILSTVLKERAHLVEYFRQVGLAALAFNLASLAVGYLVPRVARLPERQAIAIGMEIGIHNGTLAIAIASGPTLLNNSAMAVPPAIYSLIMFFTAALFGALVSRRAQPAAAT